MFELEAYSGKTNLAALGTATQSTTYPRFPASNANDGSTSTFSHTNDANAYLQIDFSAAAAQVDSVIIKNRWCKNTSDPNGCLCRLSAATVSILDANDAVIDSTTLGDTCGAREIPVSFSCHTTSECPVLSVKIESTTGEQLQVFEVEASLDGSAVTFDSAEQSSTFSPRFPASNAIDGSFATFSHTNDANAFLKLNFAQQDIDSVKIFNRWCTNSLDPSGCLCRLSRATVSLIDINSNVVESVVLGNTCSQGIVQASFSPACGTSPSGRPSSESPSKKPTMVRLRL